MLSLARSCEIDRLVKNNSPRITPKQPMQRTSIAPEKNRAFTLIELLVVIAIIAILLAFSFPIIMSMR